MAPSRKIKKLSVRLCGAGFGEGAFHEFVVPVTMLATTCRRELMERMGHSSPRAALIYPHATRERDQTIAKGMGKLFADAKKTSAKKTGTDSQRSGTQRARGPRRAS
jgi:hypothetical protein